MTDHPVFVVLTSSESVALLGRKLLTHYRSKQKASESESLGPQEIGLEPADFAALDRNRDGALDLSELAAFGEKRPDLEVNVRLGRAAGVDLVGQEGTSPAGVGKAKEGGVSLAVGITRLEVRSGQAEGILFRGVNIARQVYAAQFQAADKDNNGYLDQQEAQQSPFLRSTFPLLDRDGDGKVFEKEMFAYLDQIQALQNKVKACCATLTVTDQGRGLFDLVDANRDGRLSIRELRQALQRVEPLDRDGDGQVSRAEIPRSYQLTLAPGVPTSNQFPGAVVVVSRYGMTTPTKEAPAAGPLWFRKMDRNRDGDVSRREFLDTDEEFQRLDTDGDGLISVAEAEQADAALRQAKVKNP